MGEPSRARVPGTRTGTRRIAGSGITPLAADTTIAGKYRILSLLGEGGMGAVYRAEHVSMQRKVALKVMHAQYATDPSAAVRFEREAQAASRISTPHVVTIYDFGRADDGQLYLVMELLEGESLADRIVREGAVPWSDAIDITIQIARALAVAHEAGVVHRDLKPENVFLSEDGLVKVLDFGIARFVAKDDVPMSRNLTEAGTILGTALYMSPEAVAREAVGPPADLYALGAILFELLAGRVLFEEENPVLLMGAHLRMPPERVLEARPDLAIPAALDGLVDQLLAKDPAARPASAIAVCEQLQQMLIDGAPLVSGTKKAGAPPPVPNAARVEVVKPHRSRAALWIGLGAALIVILVGFGVGALLSSSDPAPPAPAPQIQAVAPVSAPVAPEPPASIELAFEILPAGAEVTMTHDGEPMEGRTLEVPGDGREHTFVITAPGYQSATRTVRAERDRDVAIVLVPVPRSRPLKTRPAPEEPREERPREGSLIRRF